MSDYNKTQFNGSEDGNNPLSFSFKTSAAAIVFFAFVVGLPGVSDVILKDGTVLLQVGGIIAILKVWAALSKARGEDK